MDQNYEVKRLKIQTINKERREREIVDWWGEVRADDGEWRQIERVGGQRRRASGGSSSSSSSSCSSFTLVPFQFQQSVLKCATLNTGGGTC